MTAATIDPNVTMAELLAVYPGAQRALFRKYHIGGCASCGFQPEETLAEICARNEGVPVEEVAAHILASHEADARVQVAPSEAAALMREGKARLVDLRTREEYDAVHIEGSTFFTQEMMHEIGGWDREVLIIFVDHQGVRVLDAVAYFNGHGVENVRALRGGIDAWSCEVDADLPRLRTGIARIMVLRFIIFHGVWLLVTGAIICLLFMWTFDATKLFPEYFANPLRAWFRFVFTLIMGGLLIGTQILVARKYPNS